MEQATLDGDDEHFRSLALYAEPDGDERIEAKLELQVETIEWKIDHGWRVDHAEAYTLLSCCPSALSRSIRAKVSDYAASVHMVCEALAAQVIATSAEVESTVRQSRVSRVSRVSQSRKTGRAGSAGKPAPFAYVNLSGTFGLASDDSSWEQFLTGSTEVGSEFRTSNIVSAFADPRCVCRARRSSVGPPLSSATLPSKHASL